MAESSITDHPARVDKYELLAPIGEGGMASVYRARFTAPGGAFKQVALKLIHPHLSREPDFVRMFLDEMRVAMALEHRNIVQTFDAGSAGGSYYLVMELMNGGSLARLLRTRREQGQPLPLDIALFIAMEVCAALEHAHAFRPPGTAVRGVVHRDVSPGNILLSDQGDVKLADFGVAKAAGRISSSHAGLIKGKLSYMAPEQARGQVEPRSDLFALGAVLYWMVSGTPLRSSPSIEQARQGAGKVRLPRHAAPAALERLITSCLARKPAARPESAAALRQELAAQLEQIRQSEGTGRDLHGRLRAFLGPQDPDPDPPDGGARRLARAMMEMALAVPTDHGPGGAPQESTEISRAIEPATAVELSPPRVSPTPPAPGGTVRRVLGGAALVLAALSIVGVIALWPAAPVEQAPATAPGPDLRAPNTRPAADRVAPDTAPRDAASPADLVPADLRRRVKHPPRRRVRRRPRHGRLDINASPWARVYVDGRHVGSTPLQGLRLRAGRHQVRLVNPQRKLSASFTVRIHSGQTTRRAVRLRPTLE